MADVDTTAPPRRSRVSLIARGLGIVTATAFVALLTYGLLAQAPDRTIDDRLANQQAADAPDFELEVLERGRVPPPLDAVVRRAAADGRIALSELRGTPVVLNFWASWCIPCREEAPTLERGWRQAAAQGALFIGLDMQDVRADAREFLREFSVSYPNIREPGKDTARAYGATGIPETYFITPAGKVVGHVVGVVTAEQLRAGVQATRTGRPRQLGIGGAQLPTR